MVESDGKLPILVWPFSEAPKQLRILSTNGGDEDWLVHVPAHFADDSCWMMWIQAMDSLRDPQKFELADGSVVYIGSHA